MDARSWMREFVQWYNHEHHHSGLSLLTPGSVHEGSGPAVLAARGEVLERAYSVHPERFVRGVPRPGELPAAVWINPPAVTAPIQEGESRLTPALPVPAAASSEERSVPDDLP